MVKETRIVFSPKDILAVRVTCESCRREVVLRLDEKQAPPTDCPMCRDSWEMVGQNNFGLGVVKAMRNLAKHGDARVSLRFEIDGED